VRAKENYVSFVPMNAESRRGVPDFAASGGVKNGGSATAPFQRKKLWPTSILIHFLQTAVLPGSARGPKKRDIILQYFSMAVTLTVFFVRMLPIKCWKKLL
jgi:hypothetical protein